MKILWYCSQASNKIQSMFNRKKHSKSNWKKNDSIKMTMFWYKIKETTDSIKNKFGQFN